MIEQGVKRIAWGVGGRLKDEERCREDRKGCKRTLGNEETSRENGRV